MVYLGEGRFLDDGPHRSRLAAHRNPLLHGYHVHTCGAIKDIREADLRQLLVLNGATPLSREHLIESKHGRAVPPNTIVLFDGMLRFAPADQLAHALAIYLQTKTSLLKQCMRLPHSLAFLASECTGSTTPSSTFKFSHWSHTPSRRADMLGTTKQQRLIAYFVRGRSLNRINLCCLCDRTAFTRMSQNNTSGTPSLPDLSMRKLDVVAVWPRAFTKHARFWCS